jgi:hypothetical protein
MRLSLSEKTEAQMLLEAGATNEHLVSMLGGVAITLQGLKQGPEGWTVAPGVRHIIRGVEPALAAARLEKSARVLRLACAARRIEVL